MAFANSEMSAKGVPANSKTPYFEVKKTETKLKTRVRSVDLGIVTPGLILGICSDPGNNPTIGSEISTEAPYGFPLKKRKVEFKKGFNNHFLKATWGRIDQLCLQQMKALRLLTALSMLKPTIDVVDGLEGLRVVLDTLNRTQRQIYMDLFGLKCEFTNQIFRVKKVILTKIILVYLTNLMKFYLLCFVCDCLQVSPSKKTSSSETKERKDLNGRIKRSKRY